MRPIKLEMNAFGPFKDRVVVDFSQFDQSALFLLTGPTGSGKTTIFDAVTYALYGEASGDMRSESNLKSHHASDEVLCFVELTFTLGEKTVTVYRQPKQKGPGRTKKVVNRDAEFKLVIDGDLIENKVSNSTGAMNQLLGLTKDQFTQIVMLPQGEFRKLLTSKSSDKEKIFRNIFKTDIFQKFEVEMTNRYKGLKKDLERFDTLMEQTIGQVKVSDEPVLEKALEQRNYPVIIAELGRLIEADQAKFQEINQAVIDLKNQITKMERYIENRQKLQELEGRKSNLDGQAEAIQAYKASLTHANQAKALQVTDQAREKTQGNLRQNEADLQKLNEKSENLQAKLDQTKQQLADHQKKLAEIPALEEKRKQLEAEAHLWEQIAELETSLKDLEDKKAKAKRAIESSQKKVADLDDEAEKVNQELAKIPQFRADLKDLEKRRDQLRADKLAAERKEDGLADARADAKVLAADEIELEKAQAKYDRIHGEHIKLGQIYFSNQAAILAEDLSDDQPCPVCGSTHHPDPARHGEGDVSKEALDRKEKEKNKAQEAFYTLEARVERQWVELREALESYDLPGGDDLAGVRALLDEAYTEAHKLTEKLKAEFDENEKEASAIENILANEDRWRAHVADLAQKKSESQGHLQQAQADLNHYEEGITSNQTKLAEVKDQLTTDSSQALKVEIQAVEKEVDEIRQVDKRLNDLHADLKSDVAKNQTSIGHKQEDAKRLKEELEENQAQFENLAAKSEIGKDYQVYLLDDGEVKKREQAIENHNNALIEVKANLETVRNQLPDDDDGTDIADYQNQLEDLVDKEKAQSDQRDQLNVRKASHQQALESIETNYQAQKDISEDAGIYQELSEMASGKSGMTDKISFERYVLSVYFDDILLAANERLDLMTAGRYSLERQTENFSGGGGKGLETEVFDQHTGKRRSVNTLSGGEMFKASLSLALGLSDVIQNQLGGVQVNTLFIDEGFGTLDADSLDQAVQVLMELNQTGRLVGIISHVDELKARIPSKIVVSRNQSGSQVDVVT